MESTVHSENKTPSQARQELKGRLRAQSSKTNFSDTPSVIGSKSALNKSIKEKITRSHFARRKILNVPAEIQAANPDKHFVFVNYAKMERQGFFHADGYEIYRTSEDPENMNKDKFLGGSQNLVRRNEMVLAYIPQADYEYRQAERAIVRENKDVTEVLTKNPDLLECSPLGNEEKEYLMAIKKTDKE